jgi:hypothetical protein
VHKSYELNGPRVCQHHPGGGKSVAVSASDAVLLTFGHLDTMHCDAAGNVIQDSKAKRIADDEALLHSVLPKVAGSPLLRGLLASYRAAVEDPANEFVHLYEVKDALVRHFGTEEAAGIALNIPEKEWRRLRVLANVEPVDQGRHRGQHLAGRRPATVQELDEARKIVRNWIHRFADSL